MTDQELHPVVEAAAEIARAPLTKAAPKLAAAQPKTSSAVLSLFKTVFLPMLAPVLGALIAKYGGEKLAVFLEPARDVLVAAYPVEPVEGE